MATAQTARREEKWDLTNPPPKGHADVAGFAWELFQIAEQERDRLGIPDRWRLNYDLYRGKHFSQIHKKSQMVEVNLFFANVERTRANITARNPVFEVVDMDGQEDEADKALTSYGKKWWKDTRQKKKLSSTSLNMEIYGATIEKAFWDSRRKKGDVAILDPFSFFPAPGYYEDISAEAPFVCHAYPEQVGAVEKMFDTTGVQPSDVYSLLGEDREESRPIPANVRPGSAAHYTNNAGIVSPEFSGGKAYRDRRALVVEVWIRDYTMEEYQKVVARDMETGANITKPAKRLKYPGGIRVVTVTNNGEKLLNDMPNPNINPAIDRAAAKQTFLYDRFPFAKATSYSDTTSLWGFSAAEQVGDLNYKIDQLMSRLFAWANRTMFPPLIVPEDTQIPRSAINNKPNLVLQPATSESARGIGFAQIPSIPPQFFQFIDYLMNLYDRIYQIEDADRGETPGNVVAASAIVALQERNAVLIQQKINSVDELIEFRGKALISFLQNFGTQPEQTEIQNEPVRFRGVDFRGRRFNFVIEAGSTMPKTSLQVQEQAKEFYQMGVIDRQALLEVSEFPNAKEIMERIGEGQLNQALQILIQAGLPEEQAMQLRNYLIQSQGGPGNRRQEGQPGQGQRAPAQGGGNKQPQPGQPKAKQGKEPARA